MTLRRLGDRAALIVCAIVIDASLAWVAFHPAVAGVVQLATVAVVLTWRFRLNRPNA